MRKFLISIEAIPQSLHQSKPRAIPLHELASLLEVDPSRLLPAIQHGYIKLVCAEPPTVYEPPPAAIEWLRLMYMPIPLRPFLSSEMVAELESIDLPDVRRLCLAYDIPLHDDPVFGELMSVSAFYRFHTQLHHYREPSRFDRQALVIALMQAANPEKYKQDLRPPRYSKRLEKEIQRIAKLPEPQKTEFALRLIDAFADAKSVMDCVAAARGLEPATFKEMDKAERIVAVETEMPPEGGTICE